MSDHVKGSRLRRFAKFATVAALTAKDLLSAEAKRRVINDKPAPGALDGTAARLVAVLGELKGAATKLGQFISLVDQDTFPAEARKVLSKLLSQAPHRMKRDEAAEVVARELGAPPEELFRAFSEEPIAAASMGQVHAATLKDGRDVVVKVQYPGVEKSIESDLANVALLAKALSFAGSLLDGRAYLDEIAETLRRELDYEQEAHQLEEYRSAARPWLDRLRVPEVILEFSRKRVLTLERLRGPTMFEFAQDPARTPEERFRVAAYLVAAIWGPFLRERLIHADPHPGNYIVCEDGRLGVLDFGATKRLSVPFTVAYWRMARAAVERQRADILPQLVSAGFEMRGDTAELSRWLDALADICERPIRRDDYDWDACKIATDVRAHAAAHVGAVLRCRAPAEGVMFYRAAAGAAGDFRMLKAKGDFRATFRALARTAAENLEPALLAAGGPALFAAS